MNLKQLHDHRLPTAVLDFAFPKGEGPPTTVYVACFDGQIYSVDLATGKKESFAEKHSSYASGSVLTADGKTLLTSGYDGQLLWHDTATRQCTRRVKAHEFWSWQLSISPDGAKVASVTGQYLPGNWKYEPAAETEPSVKVFSVETGDLLAEFPHIPPVQCCAFTNDGRFLAAGNMMGEIRTWDLTQPKETQPLIQCTTADFTSWGSTKTHHYCGGIFALAFSPDDSQLLCCGMGPMVDPMAGNGKMTWQRWDWRKGQKVDQIKDGQHGNGLMESVAWQPDGQRFLMAGRQAQGTWNLAVFGAKDGSLIHSIDTKKRITRAKFTPDGKFILVSGATGQPAPKDGAWPSWGRLLMWEVS
jgi:WD40 repeat protein